MAKSTDSQKPQAQGPQSKKAQGQKPQAKPQGQKPQAKPQGQKPQAKPQGQKPQGQKPQAKPQGQKPQSRKSQSDSKGSIISGKWKTIVGVIIFIAMIVAIILLVVFSKTKENLQLPPESPQDLINPITQAKNKYNIYSSQNDFIVNSNNWNVANMNGLYGTDETKNAGKPGTNFSFVYPTTEKEGAQIVNDQGYCLDTNPFQPGNNPNIISHSWWWNPKCFSSVVPEETLKDGQVGFFLNKNNQLEFKKNGMCLDCSNFNKKSVCKENKENLNTFYNIEQLQLQVPQEQESK